MYFQASPPQEVDEDLQLALALSISMDHQTPDQQSAQIMSEPKSVKVDTEPGDHRGGTGDELLDQLDTDGVISRAPRKPPVVATEPALPSLLPTTTATADQIPDVPDCEAVQVGSTFAEHNSSSAQHDLCLQWDLEECDCLSLNAPAPEVLSVAVLGAADSQEMAAAIISPEMPAAHHYCVNEDCAEYAIQECSMCAQCVAIAHELADSPVSPSSELASAYRMFKRSNCAEDITKAMQRVLDARSRMMAAAAAQAELVGSGSCDALQARFLLEASGGNMIAARDMALSDATWEHDYCSKRQVGVRGRAIGNVTSRTYGGTYRVRQPGSDADVKRFNDQLEQTCKRSKTEDESGVIHAVQFAQLTSPTHHRSRRATMAAMPHTSRAQLVAFIISATQSHQNYFCSRDLPPMMLHPLTNNAKLFWKVKEQPSQMIHIIKNHPESLAVAVMDDALIHNGRFALPIHSDRCRGFIRWLVDYRSQMAHWQLDNLFALDLDGSTKQQLLINTFAALYPEPARNRALARTARSNSIQGRTALCELVDKHMFPEGVQSVLEASGGAETRGASGGAETLRASGGAETLRASGGAEILEASGSPLAAIDGPLASNDTADTDDDQSSYRMDDEILPDNVERTMIVEGTPQLELGQEVRIVGCSREDLNGLVGKVRQHQLNGKIQVRVGNKAYALHSKFVQCMVLDGDLDKLAYLNLRNCPAAESLPQSARQALEANGCDIRL